jgi:hypothetical protein
MVRFIGGPHGGYCDGFPPRFSLVVAMYTVAV